MLDSLSIWYMAPVKRCNLKCSYCVSGQPNISDNNEWFRPEDEGNHLQVMKWIRDLPYKIKLRLGTTGEPFLSKTFLDSVAETTNAPNLEFVEVLTNGSFSRATFESFISKSDIKKLSLWMTYHHKQMNLESFVKSAILANEAGVSVVVHALLFPDSIDSTKLLSAECEKQGLTLHVGLGQNINNAYPGKEFIPVLDDKSLPGEMLDSNVAFPDIVYALAEKPIGSPCSAGHSYIHINSFGEVHRCYTYSNRLPLFKLGSALDPSFKLVLDNEKFAPCFSKQRCQCVEDYQHLKVAQELLNLQGPHFIPSKPQDIAALHSTQSL